MRIIVCLLVVLIVGCTHINHSDQPIVSEEDFQLEKISGVYSNIPSGSSKTPRLSQFVFPNKDEQHHLIDEIKVVVDKNRIICEGFMGQEVLISKEYINGKDFTFNGNLIELSEKGNCSGCIENKFYTGWNVSDYTLYLAENGDALLREKGAGVFIAVVPIFPFRIWEYDLIYRRVSD